MNTPPRDTDDGRRIPTLDGWRGIAILLVLLDHIEHSFTDQYVYPWTQTGQHGVTIFFVLSGFLITSKLLEGPIDLKRFYIRRFFRLMPVAWAFLAVLILLSVSLHATLTTPTEVWSCLFFYRNFEGSVGQAGHFWSLSLEEQFYLVWPWVLVLAGAKRSRWIAAGGAVACAGYRWLFWGYYDRLLFDTQSQVRADALLLGCLAALLLNDVEIRRSAAQWSKYLALPALIVLLYCMARFHWLPPFSESLAIAILMVASTLHPNSVFARPLSLAPLEKLGKFSYSIYVWQALFMFDWPVGLHITLLCVGLPLIVIASYSWIEKPLTQLGRRLTRKPSHSAERVAV